VLELVIAHALYERFPDYSEGQLAKLRSHVVSRASCAVVAEELRLGDRLLAEASGPDTEEQRGLVHNRNILAAILEAVLAALYLEHGFGPIAPAIVEAFGSRIDYALSNQVDHKTELQETVARLGRTVAYFVLDAVGPAHKRTFTMAATIDGEQAGTGVGSSKKAAEQLAAREALEWLARDLPA